MIFLPGQLLKVDKGGAYSLYHVWVEEVDYEFNYIKAPWCVRGSYVHWDYGWMPREFAEWVIEADSVSIRENVSRDEFIALSNAREEVLRW